MDKVIQFIKERGHVLMMAGLFTVIAGTMAYMILMNYPALRQSPYMRNSAMVLVFIGLGIYVVGRVSVAVQRRRVQMEERIRERRGRSGDGGGL
ncbi:MAG: hypothetical protein FWB85_01055 [Chitinispirillia bacterium]|nr:hypothetical protein [Chitinispirillia bacterium]